MALVPVTQLEPKKKGGIGGALGSLAGMAVGALLAAPTGGASIPAGAALGGTLGGTAGGLMDQPKLGDPGQNAPMVQSKPIQTMKMHPEVMLAGLNEAEKAVKDSPQISTQEAASYLDLFTKAKQPLKQRLGL